MSQTMLEAVKAIKVAVGIGSWSRTQRALDAVESVATADAEEFKKAKMALERWDSGQAALYGEPNMDIVRRYFRGKK